MGDGLIGLFLRERPSLFEAFFFFLRKLGARAGRSGWASVEFERTERHRTRRNYRPPKKIDVEGVRLPRRDHLPTTTIMLPMLRHGMYASISLPPQGRACLFVSPSRGLVVYHPAVDRRTHKTSLVCPRSLLFGTVVVSTLFRPSSFFICSPFFVFAASLTLLTNVQLAGRWLQRGGSPERGHGGWAVRDQGRPRLRARGMYLSFHRLIYLAIYRTSEHPSVHGSGLVVDFILSACL